MAGKLNTSVLQAPATPIMPKMEVQKPVLEPRERLKGDKIACPKCRKDAFIYKSKAYPAVIAVRMRYCKCGTCGHTFKIN